MVKPGDPRFSREIWAKGFRKRFRKAYRDLQDEMEESGTGRLTRTMIGRMLEKKLGKGRSANAVSEWWTGKSIPDTIPIAALADVLGVSPGWLAFGEGEMRADGGLEENGPPPGLAPDPRRPRVTPTDLDDRVNGIEATEDEDQEEGE